MYILTISRTLGSLGDDIAKKCALYLGVPIIDKEMSFAQWFPDITDDHGIHMLRSSYAFYHHTYDEQTSYKDYLTLKLKEAVRTGPKIFLGMGSHIIFQDHPSTIHVRINAPFDIRLMRLQDEWKLPRDKALALLEESDTRRKKFIRKVHGVDWEDESLFDLRINTRQITVDTACEMIRSALANTLEQSAYNANQLSLFQTPAERSDFRHDIEREFAMILDNYGMEWEYEPTTFPLEFDDEGNITQAIAPDFYLIREDTYIELTVMNPKYMAEKRRKIEKLREQYPEVNVILMDKKGLHALIERHKLKTPIKENHESS